MGLSPPLPLPLSPAGADSTAMRWYRQSELVHARWAMLGVAGILGNEIIHPDQWWYTAGLPENLPDLPVGGKMNLGGVLAWEFLLMHCESQQRGAARGALL